MTNKRELSNDEADLLRDESLPPSESEEVIEDDEWAGFRNLSEAEKKWALLQLQLDREKKYFDSMGMTD